MLSHADAPEVFGGHEVKPVKGDIRVFTSLADPTNLKPTLVVRTNTDTSLVQILKQMQKKYRPIESKSLTLIVFHCTHI